MGYATTMQILGRDLKQITEVSKGYDKETGYISKLYK